MPKIGNGIGVAFLARYRPRGDASPWLFNDDYQRDDQLLTADGRYLAPLVGDASALTVTSNVVRHTGVATFVPLNVQMPDNFAVEIDVPSSTPSSNSFFAVRAQSPYPHTTYLGLRVRPGGSAEVYNQINGSFGSLGATSNFAGGDTARFEVIGQEVRILRITKDSMTRILASSSIKSELASGGIAGIHGRASGVQNFIAGLRIEPITAFSG